jgi:hypothetical protein
MHVHNFGHFFAQIFLNSRLLLLQLDDSLWKFLIKWFISSMGIPINK